MKIRITAEYEVTQTKRGFDIMDDSGMCLTSNEDLGAAMHSLAGMVENEMLDPAVFEIQVIDVLDTTKRSSLDPLL